MDKTERIERPPLFFSDSEKVKIIEEYLSSHITKVDIWRKYTGHREEHGSLLKWMRRLGYADKPRYSVLYPPLTQFAPTTLESTSDISNLTPEEYQKKIKDLEKQLHDAQVKAEGYNLMIDIAERDFKIPIRKKSDTK